MFVKHSYVMYKVQTTLWRMNIVATDDKVNKMWFHQL